MNQSIEDILNGPEYFYCDRYKIRMKKTECARRQTAPEIHSHEIDHTFTCCKDCEQGEFIKAELGGQLSEVRKKTRRPPRMDLVAGAFASQEDEKMEEKKVCSNCGKEKPINEFTKNPGCRGGREGQCKQCRLEKAKARRWAKDVTKKDPVVERKKKKQQAVTGENKELSTKLLPPKDDAICIARAGFPLSMDIARLEAENAESIQEAAKYIIASVKKDLLGAVFQELRSK